MPTVADVNTAAKALLNDTFGDIFTDGILLPFIKKAYTEFTRECILNELQVIHEMSAALDVAANATTVANPADMLYPISIEERAEGSTVDTDWDEMEERQWEDNEARRETLDVWVFRENTIVFRGATSNREVRIKYNKLLPDLSGSGSTLIHLDITDFLASRAAAIAAATVGGNLDRAAVLQDDAEQIKNTLMKIGVKEIQQFATRRQPGARNL